MGLNGEENKHEKYIREDDEDIQPDMMRIMI